MNSALKNASTGCMRHGSRSENSGGRTCSSASYGLCGGVSKFRIARSARSRASLLPAVDKESLVTAIALMPRAGTAYPLGVRIWRKGGSAGKRRLRSGAAPSQDQRGIGAAESEGVGQDSVDRPPVSLVRHEIDGGRDRGVVEIKGGRRKIVSDRQRREDRLDRTGRAEQMADRRFGRRH